MKVTKSFKALIIFIVTICAVVPMIVCTFINYHKRGVEKFVL